MSRKLGITICAILLIVGLGIGLGSATRYYLDLPHKISQQETIVLGQNRFVPGSQAALRVLTRDSRDGTPVESASILISIRPESGGESITLFKGITDSGGSANVIFDIPEETAREQTLVIQTSSDLGSDTLERPVTIERDYKVLITTDKPIYQPGQEIHIRVLGLSAFDLVPAAQQDLEIIITDGKGNKVYRRSFKTSEWGVVGIDFRLASEVNTGAYKITVDLGHTTSEKTVRVEQYVLPKFKVNLETEKTFYLPGEHVRGALSADYFFGKPVASGVVAIEGSSFDVERVPVVTFQGDTDENGQFEFEFDLPHFMAGTELDGGLGRFNLQASVTDLAQHTEISNLSLPISRNALVIDAIPEGGQLKPGLENIIYVLTSYPDGSPAETSLIIESLNTGESYTIETGRYGLAEIPFTPNETWQNFYIQAYDEFGNSSDREFYFESQWSTETVLLRPERPVYNVGETMNLTILTSARSGTVYLDVVREGQTINTRAVEITDGIAQVALDLTTDLYGTLVFHAYKILQTGHTIRDTRLVVVDKADDLTLSMAPQSELYRPGESAVVDILVRDLDGRGSQAAIGLAVVDESVFALAEGNPGFAKLYFLLESELLKPKYDLHGFSFPELVGGFDNQDPDFLNAIEGAAQASLSEASPNRVSFSLQANSHEDAMQRVNDLKLDFFSNLSIGLYTAFLGISLVYPVIAFISVARERIVGRSLLTALGVLAIPILLLLIWPHDWAVTPIDKLSIFFDWLSWDGEIIILAMVVLAFAGLITLIVVAVRTKDRLLGWGLGLIPVVFGIVLYLAYAFSQSRINPKDSVLLLGLIAYLLIPVGFLLRSMGFLYKKNIIASLAAFFLGIFLLIGIFPAAIASGGGMYFSSRSAGGLMVEPLMGEVDMMQAVPGINLEGGFALDVVEESHPVEKQAESDGDDASGSNTAEPPRLRQFFPETMLWMPEIITDDNGDLVLEIPVADSITTWRMTALASTQDGRLGSTTAPLRVFQDFFIDLDLPLALTVGDEVSVPVGIFNYLEDPQTVRLELESADWFELLDETEKEIEIGANDISVVYFRVRALRFGHQSFKVTAWGSRMSDAILKQVRIYPNGKQIRFSESDRLSPDEAISEIVNIPGEAIPGTQQLMVKIYPGILSQVVEGLESILRMPSGCFEQTSSTTYPNVLVLDYLGFTDHASPELQFKAEEYINLGYQRLVTFEVDSSGGFSLFGDPPPDRMLTAYGLQEFSDMSQVYPVDPVLLQRAAEWLFSQQDQNGSWKNDRGLVHENTWANLGDDRIPVTAYIVWSLAEAGYAGDSRTQSGLAYVKENSASVDDPYILALTANAMVAVDITTGAEITEATLLILDRLAERAIQEGKGVYWRSSVATFMGSEGQTGSIETTALASLAFLRANRYPELTNAALTNLIQQKDGFGTWYSTQATVLSLKALIQSVRSGAETVNANVKVVLNNGETQTIAITPENFDVVQLLEFDDINIGRENIVDITIEGESSLIYQVTGSYYMPWETLPNYPQLTGVGELVNIELTYDRTELAVDETVGVNVVVTLNEGQAESALIDLGLPPGFSVETKDLAALVARFDDVPEDYTFPTIQRFELTGRQILIYASNLIVDHPLEFSYRLRAKFPLTAQTPASNAYDYYNPDVFGEVAPVTLVVK